MRSRCCPRLKEPLHHDGEGASSFAVRYARETAAAVGEAAGEPVRLIGHRFQNPCGMRNARLRREDAFSHAMVIVAWNPDSTSGAWLHHP